MVARLAASALAFVAVAAALVGCGDDGPRPIDDVRTRPAERPAPRLGVPAIERLGLGPPWTYEAPPQWTPVERDAPGRVATFEVRRPGDGGGAAASAEAPEVALSTAGGTPAANVDRWRAQMGWPPAGDAGVAALPRRPFLGREGLLVDLRGTYGGTGGAGLADARLLALLLPLPGTNVALKLVGPAAVVDAEAARFFAFAATARSRFAPVAEPTAAPPPPVAGSATAGGYRFVVPAGWTAGPEKSMRVATYYVGGRRDVEVSLHEFGAVAGGVLLNVNRWRAQLGLPDATPEEVAALPRLPMAGGTATVVELTGSLSDPMRGVELDDAFLFGAIVERGDKLLFVKLTGPAAAARTARADVEAFCRSIEAAP